MVFGAGRRKKSDFKPLIERITILALNSQKSDSV